MANYRYGRMDSSTPAATVCSQVHSLPTIPPTHPCELVIRDTEWITKEATLEEVPEVPQRAVTLACTRISRLCSHTLH